MTPTVKPLVWKEYGDPGKRFWDAETPWQWYTIKELYDGFGTMHPQLGSFGTLLEAQKAVFNHHHDAIMSTLALDGVDTATGT